MSKRIILQREVYICNLGENIGSEQNGLRPCIILQLDVLNKTSKNVIIVPITSKSKKDLPTHVILTKEQYPFLHYRTNTVLCENIRSLSKDRLEKCIGQISTEDFDKIMDAMQYAFVEQ